MPFIVVCLFAEFLQLIGCVFCIGVIITHVCLLDNVLKTIYKCWVGQEFAKKRDCINTSEVFLFTGELSSCRLVIVNTYLFHPLADFVFHLPNSMLCSINRISFHAIKMSEVFEVDLCQLGHGLIELLGQGMRFINWQILERYV